MSGLFQDKPKPPYLYDPVLAAAAAPRQREYKLIVSDHTTDLEKQVNAHLTDGWSPVGGVQVILDRHPDCQGHSVVEWSFHQAILRYV